jgi:hypothetical protein
MLFENGTIWLCREGLGRDEKRPHYGVTKKKNEIERLGST